MPMEVIMAHNKSSMSPITPGTKLYAPFICGLYSNDSSVLTATGAASDCGCGYACARAKATVDFMYAESDDASFGSEASERMFICGFCPRAMSASNPAGNTTAIFILPERKSLCILLSSLYRYFMSKYSLADIWRIISREAPSCE